MESRDWSSDVCSSDLEHFHRQSAALTIDNMRRIRLLRILRLRRRFRSRFLPSRVRRRDEQSRCDPDNGRAHEEPAKPVHCDEPSCSVVEQCNLHTKYPGTPSPGFTRQNKSLGPAVPFPPSQPLHATRCTLSLFADTCLASRNGVIPKEAFPQCGTNFV